MFDSHVFLSFIFNFLIFPTYVKGLHVFSSFYSLYKFFCIFVLWSTKFMQNALLSSITFHIYGDYVHTILYEIELYRACVHGLRFFFDNTLDKSKDEDD